MPDALPSPEFPPLSAPRLERARIAPSDTIEDAGRTLISALVAQLRQHEAGTRTGQNPEALHDFRVAVRRARAAVRVFAPAFPARVHDRLTADLIWLQRLAGTVRDLDVQLENVAHAAAGLPTPYRTALAGLRRHIENERSQRRRDLVAGLDSPRYGRLLLALDAFGQSRRRLRLAGAKSLFSRYGSALVRHGARRLRRRAAALPASPTPEELHAVRIRARGLRYVLEFLHDLTGRRGRRLVKALVQLQDELGAHHDAVVMADVVHSYVQQHQGTVSSAALLALGAIANRALLTADDQLARFHRSWGRFVRRRTRQRIRGVRRRLRRLRPGNRSTSGDRNRAQSRSGADLRSARMPAAQCQERSGT